MLAIVAAIVFAIGLLLDLLDAAIPRIGGTAFVLLGLCLLALHQGGIGTAGTRWRRKR